MMRRVEFVTMMLDQGNAEPIIQMLLRKGQEMAQQSSAETFCYFKMASIFLDGVLGSLRRLDLYENWKDDAYLAVWLDMGFVGIEFEEIKEYLTTSADDTTGSSASGDVSDD